ncbi:MAG: TonB-dependent receptor [Bacteroidota bacterium]
MKKILLILVLIIFSTTWLNAQTASVEGTVTDVTGNPLPGVTVNVGNKTAQTDATGKYIFESIGFGKTEISFAFDGYENKTITIDINTASVKIGYTQIKSTITSNTNENSGESTIATVESEDDIKDQYVSGLLHSSNDPFVSISGYTLSAGYFRPRGYDNEYSEVMIGGLALNDPETGRPNFSDWGGLNDATRFKESAYGLNPTRYSFGTIAGTSDIDVRASHQRKQIKASYAYSNRTYTNRVMLTASTGMMKNNWAVTVSASTRQGNTGYVKGTFYDAWSYFISVEKKINAKHSISFTGFGAPAKRGMQSAATQECYDLLDNNYYNPNWGLQNGEVKNAKVRNSHEPVLLLSHFFDINDKIKLTTTLGYSFGRTSTTALNWYNAADPRPDYYRYLPSWQTNMDTTVTPYPAVVTAMGNAWKNSESTNQINWDRLYQINYLSALSGEQTRYIVEERRLDHSQLALASHVNYEINKNVFFSGGLNVDLYKSRNYKVMADMLDGNGYEGYWLDVDQFAAQDFPTDTNILQNDLNNPNRIIKKGDVFGYDYDIHINSANLWGLGEFTFNHFDFYVGLNFTGTQFWRNGNMRNGRFSENSYGKSDKFSFLDYAAKAGVTYKLSGRHYFVLNLAYMTMAPTFNDIFLSPRIRNTVVADIRTRKIFSGDLSYIVRYPKVTARITAFNTNFWDDTKVMSFYHDDLNTFVDYILVGINKVHQGIELGVEVKLIPVLSLQLAGSIGNYRYTNRPTAYMSVENGSQNDSTQLIYSKNFYVNGTPQSAGSIGLKFVHPKFWYANLNANLFADNWVDFNPSRRTLEALQGIYPGDARIALITEQQKAYKNPQFTLDASVGKSFKIGKVFLGINFSVSNILNNTKMVTSGYEQLRFREQNVDTFGPKYYYGLGRTYFLMASVRL